MLKTLWQEILAKIAVTTDAHRYETWFLPLVLHPESTDARLCIAVPNNFMVDFIEQHYKNTILSIAQSLQPSMRDIAFICSNQDLSSTPLSDNKKTSLLPQASLQSPGKPTSAPHHISLDDRFTFETFVVGGGNEFAKSAALAVAETPGKTKFNPLLIYSGVGLGKTHLLQAIGNRVKTSNPTYKTTYITSEEFYLNFIDAIKNNNTKQFSDKFRSADVLLMDDVQFLSGKESTQEEFFYIFNTLYQNNKQIVLTSDLPPNQTKGLQDRLVSRFQWGLSVDIQPPDLETRIAILKKKSEEQNVSIPENALVYIAEQVTSNIRLLEGSIIRLLAFASITKTDITLDVVKDVLKNLSKTAISKVTVDQIIEKIAAYYNVPVDNIREKIRTKEVALCRQIAMYITKKITNNSLKSIGLHFGGRDHSTVIHALNIVSDLIKKDESVARDVNYIMSLLKE